MDRFDTELQDLLRDYPMPEAQAGFYDEAMLRAAQHGARRTRNRWLATGFGAAVAAGIAIWFLSGVFMSSPTLTSPEAGLPGVSIALEQTNTVNLVFASATDLDSATLTVVLPAGIELAGFPGRREISWETSLKEGKNLLPLKLIALTPAGGELYARLVHNDRDREFRLRVDVS